jgi:hypothetical protein
MAPAKSGSLRVKKIANLQEPRDDEGIKVLRYEETIPAKAPIPVTVAPPRAPPTDLHPALRRPVGGLEEEDVVFSHSPHYIDYAARGVSQYNRGECTHCFNEA